MRDSEIMTKMRVVLLCVALATSVCGAAKDVVDYVNPYIGNVSHLLVPTYPCVHLPNSMLRVYPDRYDYVTEYVGGLPVIVTNHRERSAFKIIPQIGGVAREEVRYTYDNEHIKPYEYDVELDDNRMWAKYAVSHQSAIYEIGFKDAGERRIVINSHNGKLSYGADHVSGWQTVSGDTRVYVYLESGTKPEAVVPLGEHSVELKYGASIECVKLRYGVSFISEEQAKNNLRREISDYDREALALKGRSEWNRALGKIEVEGGSDDQKTVFYTSFYRIYERPICISEDGRYWNGDDNRVYNDGGVPFYTEDWIWDTYHAAHPLRALVDRGVEERILKSFLRMAEHNGTGWIPTFPGIEGDTRRMNCNHTVGTMADALWLGLDVDAEAAYKACRGALEEKSLAPWSGNLRANYLSRFYAEHGYIPALYVGEKETEDTTVHSFENRQAVAVTLGTAYDQWALSRIAEYLAGTAKDKKTRAFYRGEAAKYRELGHNYRNLYYAPTGFFYPKDRDGNFLKDFEPTFGGTMGAREYYDENNGWVYRWDVKHNVADLVRLMGGREQFKANLDRTFGESLGKFKFEFYHQFPDHTGNVGQFSMANEPAMHIPYLYNYAGYPWKTQKRVRQMLDTWFRNDVMGVPGDEDGGGLTSFVVFSMMGFYPVTPGLPAYNIGSPVFERVKLHMSNGNVLEIEARGASRDAKYIRSATLNGREWNKPWFSYADVKGGARLVMEMSSEPNKTWGVQEDAVPPSENF